MVKVMQQNPGLAKKKFSRTFEGRFFVTKLKLRPTKSKTSTTNTFLKLLRKKGCFQISRKLSKTFFSADSSPEYATSTKTEPCKILPFSVLKSC